MIKILTICLVCIFTAPLYAQELVSNDYEKGYVKEGKKYLVWDYFNDQKELEIKVNHTTGKVYFIKEDTSTFVIHKDGQWIEQKLKIYPIPLEGYQNFYQTVKKNLRYPAEARRSGIDGQVLVMFELDSAGFLSNFSVVKDIGGGCGQEVIRALKEFQTPWVVAQSDNQTYKSRFILPVTYGLGKATWTE